jgi:hypothetical protein
VDAVVTRYGGRIEAYQVWNEPADPIFWRGSWHTLARMTKVASDVIRDHDSNALVVSAPLTLRTARWREDARQYVDALADHGMPVDAIAFHGYFDGPGRSTSEPILELQEILSTSPAAGLPLWETEVNFTNAPDAASLGAQTERTWLARAYLDAIRLGVDRVYWYAYGDVPDFLAVDIRHVAVAPAFSAVSGWIADAQFRGCSSSWQGHVGITGCAFVDRQGRTAVSLWADEPRVVTAGRGTANDLQGKSWSVASTLAVHDGPVWFRPSTIPG